MQSTDFARKFAAVLEVPAAVTPASVRWFLREFVIPDFIMRRLAHSPKLAAQRRIEKRTRRRYVKQLCSGLRAGFSDAVSLLREVQDEAGQLPDNIRDAAWALACWYYSQDDYELTLQQLTKLKNLKLKEGGERQKVMLEVEALRRFGKAADAKAIIKRYLAEWGENSELCFSAANLATEDDGLTTCESNRLRLSWLNKPLLRAGYHPIAAKDPSRKLAIDNITCAAPKIPYEACNAKISVLMPAFNAEKTISFAIESVLTQSWTNLELVVVDDDSDDSTWAILQSFAAQDSRIKLIRHEQNAGAYAARNTALKCAIGEFITGQDDDDWSHPQRLATQIEHLDRTGLAFNTISSVRVDYDLRIALDPRKGLLRECFPSLMTRRKFVLELGGWDEVRMAADAELYARLAKVHQQTKTRLRAEAPLAFQLKSEGSLTSKPYTGLSTTCYGARREYAEAHFYWREQQRSPKELAALRLPTEGRAFPVPSILKKATPEYREYDVLWVSDFARTGPEISALATMLRAAKLHHLRSACFHWPRLESVDRFIDRRIRKLLHEGLVESVVPGESLKCRCVIIDDVSCINYIPNTFPKVNAESGIILVNELSEVCDLDNRNCWTISTTLEKFHHVFGIAPVLAPMSDSIRRQLQEVAPAERVTSANWMLPIDAAQYDASPRRESDHIIIGNHRELGRWLMSEPALQQAYGADAELEARFVGEPDFLISLMEQIPRNWTMTPAGISDPTEFLTGLDFYVHHSCQNTSQRFAYETLEAMAIGRPVILPPRFKHELESAAIYAEPREISSVVQALWRDKAAYQDQVQRGLVYIAKTHSPERFAQLLVQHLQ
jgi:glycosyltransferase involved in cell wall biosynthesis